MLPAMDFSSPNLVTRVLFATLILVAASYPSLRVNDNGPSPQSTSPLGTRLTAQRRRDTPVAVPQPASMHFSYVSFWKNHFQPRGEPRSQLPSDEIDSSTVVPDKDSKKFTWDPCGHTGDCEPDRLCLDLEQAENDKFANCEKGKSHDRCFCVPLQNTNGEGKIFGECDGSADCVPEEFCTKEDLVDHPFCISRTYIGNTNEFPEFESQPVPPEDQPASNVNPQSEDDESLPNDVCVDAKALEHLPSHNLVFQRHATAKVLCDANRSCATPGHMVTYKREAMMMRTYCGLAGCKEDIMAVNSPRYRRGLSIKSKTTGLEYSSFAARYQTKAEEMLIRIAVHVGL